MGDRPIRVLCVDDNRLVADALEQRLRMDPRFAWAGWTEEAAELVAHVERTVPDLVLLDIDMPGADPFAALQRLTDRHPRVRVVMFSGHVKQDFIDRSIHAGAWGYLSKNESTEVILATLLRVHAGEFVLCPEASAAHTHRPSG